MPVALVLGIAGSRVTVGQGMWCGGEDAAQPRHGEFGALTTTLAGPAAASEF
jgi:hypothetical protein